MHERFKDAQAIVLVGGRAFVAYPYSAERPTPDGVPFLHIADNAEAFGREHAADMALVGDIGATLAEAALVLRTSGDHARVAAHLAELAARRKTADDLLRAKILGEPGTPLSADAAVLAVLDALPEGALIANDSAATFGEVQALLKTRPGRYFFARGGVLGCNMPASVGAALAISDWVVSLVGDGGAMYSPQALWSAAHYRARVIFIVFNNRRYGVLQNVARSLGYANAKAGRFVGMETVDPAIDFAALSASMGTPYAKADTREAILAAFAEAVKRDGPTHDRNSDQVKPRPWDRGRPARPSALDARGPRKKPQPTSSLPENHCAISCAAVSGASEPCTEFSPIESANCLRIVPAAAFSGLVAPITSRYLAIALSPSSTCTTTGAAVIISTSSPKNGRSRCTP